MSPNDGERRPYGEQEHVEEIESLLKKGRACEAFDTALKAKAAFPENIRIAQLHALSLARLGATERARDSLEPLHEKDKGDAETAGLLGRVYKDLYKKTGDTEYARRSRDIYLHGFEASSDYYPGINAATMSLVIGETRKAGEVAREVIRACASREQDYWCLSTLGEACLLTGNQERAARHYLKALSLAGKNYGDINSTYQQILMIGAHLEIPEEIARAFKPPGIIVFSGHMIDHPDREEPRFPKDLAGPVKQEIGMALDALDAGIGYSSAACGADILFIEAMLERGAEVNVVLPFRPEDFLVTSVRFAGGDWEERFNQALARAASVKHVTVEGYFGNDDLFAFAGTIVQGLGILRAKAMGTTPSLLAVLDTSDLPAREGGTASFLEVWPFPEAERLIDLSLLRAGTARPTERTPYRNRGLPFQPPFGSERNLRCILFADMVGFSRLQEEQTPFFMYEFLRALGRRLRGFETKPEVLNTWGDAVFSVCQSAGDMARFAFALKDMVTEGDWDSKGLFPDMSIRIALHAGPVFLGTDPLIERPNAYGVHINRAARMEPVTVPGCIYASEQFAAKLVVETGDEYAFEYVGTLSLPKQFGRQETYHIRRRNEVQ